MAFCLLGKLLLELPLPISILRHSVFYKILLGRVMSHHRTCGFVSGACVCFAFFSDETE